MLLRTVLFITAAKKPVPAREVMRIFGDAIHHRNANNGRYTNPTAKGGGCIPTKIAIRADGMTRALRACCIMLDRIAQFRALPRGTVAGAL